ncbi:hypothetical protein [Candidatus Thiosymbion oneisti]|uniref:hypothetical protein n=1 Tax=Candidatus Thiosymbion oneisti TaxID=589554 RepID=UPI00105DE857|nr:hypothetical protein [Candidatus Thiosymbion oneisti]
MVKSTWPFQEICANLRNLRTKEQDVLYPSFFSLAPALQCHETLAKPNYARYFFNTDQFVGFVSMSSGGDTVTIDYELDGAGGNPISFKNCDDVKKTPATDVATHQYHLWRLMQINCKAVTMWHNAIAGTRSHWPAAFDHAFIAGLPATAIPDLGGSSLDGRKGLLKDAEPALETSTIDSHSTKAILSGDLAITYVLMGRGDFDHNGTEDILLRLDWNITTAFGKGFSLLLLSKPSVSAAAEVVWRDG